MDATAFMVKRPVSTLLGLAFGLSFAVNPAVFAQAKGFIGTRAAALADKAQAGPQAIVSSAELADTGEAATLTFTTTAPVEASAFVLGEPDRVMRRSARHRFQLDPQTGKPAKPQARRAAPAHLVDSFRFGSFAPRGGPLPYRHPISAVPRGSSALMFPKSPIRTVSG